ncbi:Cytochrome P450 71A1 [Cinnamomum micranthum f. kanehirae]|uniref:Cytochrome P450 71A1 n=1 Tax=Cinnamomum micranthum f. kanehirae TaxID=337451 RepID=A0A443PCM5_9MAGN|nr:Cytochrome P450 71A1 [Cinnamomum micranthum f. kanehirae]
MLLYLGRIPTLIVSSAEMAEQIMKTNDLIFASRPSMTAAKELLYGCTDVAFASYGLHGKLKGNSGELDRFLDQKDSNRDIHLTRDNIKAIILDMFTSGTDTTALTLEWVMAELAKHPKCDEESQGVVRRVVDVKANISEEHLCQLNYMKSIFKETLRLHPPAPLLVPRESTTNVMIQNFHIPPKTRVFIMHMQLEGTPHHGKIQRNFFQKDMKTILLISRGKIFQFIPFGAGRRGCPGFHLPLHHLNLLLPIYLLVRWELPQGVTEEDLDMSETLGMTVHKKLPLYFVPKHHFS